MAKILLPTEIRLSLRKQGWDKRPVGITKAHGDTLRKATLGTKVEAVALADAIVAGLAAAATRRGQSMLRRADRQPLIEAYAFLRDTAPRSLIRLDKHDPLVTRPASADVDHLRKRAVDAEDTARVALAQQAAAESRAAEHAAAYREAKARADGRALEIAMLKEALDSRNESIMADLAAYRFLLQAAGPDLAARAADFRTGFRAGRQA